MVLAWAPGFSATRSKGLCSRAVSYHGIHHGIAELLPFVKAAQQRTHMTDTVLSQLQRHPGAGRFVGSSAEQHDLAVARDFGIARFQIFRRDLQRPGQGSRIAEHVERMTKINDDHGLA